MKESILYVFCLSLLSLSAAAQISRGTSTVGGSIALSHKQSKGSPGKYTTQSIGIRPGYGLFLLDNLCVGVNAGFNYSNGYDSNTFNGQKLNTINRAIDAGPFVRYYLPINSKLYVFGHASYLWRWHKAELEGFFTVPEPELTAFQINYRTNSWNVGAGLSYFLTPNVALETMLGYTGHIYHYDRNGATLYRLDQRGSLALNIGFRLFLHKNG